MTWWEHSRFDVCDTWKFRVSYSLLVISPFIEMMIAAFAHHRVISFICMSLVCVWMLGIFAILGRQTHMDHKAFLKNLEDDHGQ